jgi:hypothetical protein
MRTAIFFNLIFLKNPEVEGSFDSKKYYRRIQNQKSIIKHFSIFSLFPNQIEEIE